MTPAGTWVLTRLALRRDRVLVGAWLLVLTVVVAASAAATGSLYPTAADRVAAARAIDGSPAVVALYGPVLDPRSLGELAMTKTTVLYAVLVAVLAVLLVRRQTRGEEESGRAELVGATGVERSAPLAAALLEATLVSLAAGLLATAADVAGGLPVTGSVAFGAGWAATGLVGAAVGAVACQVSASARTCAALALGTLAALYLLRALGDTTWAGVPVVPWLSPLGWSTRLRAWGDPRWWVLLLHLGLAAALTVLAVVLRGRRDLGAGLVHARPGPAHGRLGSPLGLACAGPARPGRVERRSPGRRCGPGHGGARRGRAAGLPAARAALARLGGRGGPGRALLAAELSVAAVVVTCFAVAVVARAGADEREGRTAQVLATPASRTAVLLAPALVAVVGSAWLLLVTGLGAALGAGAAAVGRSGRPGSAGPGPGRLAGHGARGGRARVGRPLGGGGVGVPGRLPHPRPGRRAAAAARLGRAALAVRPRAADARRALRARAGGRHDRPGRPRPGGRGRGAPRARRRLSGGP